MLEALAAVMKAALYASALSAAGFALALATLPWRDDVEQVALRGMRWSAAVALLASPAWALLLVVRLGGGFDSSVALAVLDSGLGARTALQAAGALMLLTSAGDDAFARFWRAASAGMLTLSFAFSGHPATIGAHGSLLAMLHASAAAWWIGCLWLLRRACNPSNALGVEALILRFSSIAIGVVGALVLAGVLLILVLIDLEEPGWFDQYERLLLVKIGLALAALSFASFNKLRLTPRLLTADQSAIEAMRRSITLELAAIGAVLVATATLTTYFSP